MMPNTVENPLMMTGLYEAMIEVIWDKLNQQFNVDEKNKKALAACSNQYKGCCHWCESIRNKVNEFKMSRDWKKSKDQTKIWQWREIYENIFW